MVYVPPPPLLVVRSHDPRRRWRSLTLVAVAWLLSVAAVAGGLLLLRDHGIYRSDRAEVERMAKANGDLQQRIAILERSEQVARAATAELQQTLRDRQEQVSALRADLGFYSRLTGNGVKREGLAVQAISLARSAEARVYDFTITVTQNLKAGQLASGHVRLSVTGIQAGKLVTLAWAALAPNQDAEGLAFEFKYFQQLKGALMLPAGFMPNRIRAEADAGGDMGRAEQDFAWSEALTIPEIADVHK